jgi:proteasome alpha subunit
MTQKQAIELGEKAIEKALGEKPIVETGVVAQNEKVFRKLRAEK